MALKPSRSLVICTLLFLLSLTSCSGELEDFLFGGAIYSVGDIGPSGGYIFYDKGYYSDSWRYLEAAPEGWNGADADPAIMFGYTRDPWNGQNRKAGFGRDYELFFLGKANTRAIIRYVGETAYSNSSGKAKAPYAASLCWMYRGGGFDDWFLPSERELDLMYKNLKKRGLGSFSSSRYWSSSEDGALFAFSQDFYGGGGHLYEDRNMEFCVRPVRSF